MLFVQSPLVAATPPFSPIDVVDMSRKLSIAEMKKMVAERAEHQSVGPKRKAIASLRGHPEQGENLLGRSPLFKPSRPAPPGAITHPLSPPLADLSVPTEAVGASVPGSDPMDRSFLS